MVILIDDFPVDDFCPRCPKKKMWRYETDCGNGEIKIVRFNRCNLCGYENVLKDEVRGIDGYERTVEEHLFDKPKRRIGILSLE